MYRPLLALTLASALSQIPVDPSITTFVQFGCFGVVCFTVWWLLTKTIPNLTQTFREEIEEIRKVFQEEMERDRTTFAAQIQKRDDLIRDKDEKIIGVLREIRDK
jgi:plastocyanin domain-containing protein